MRLISALTMTESLQLLRLKERPTRSISPPPKISSGKTSHGSSERLSPKEDTFMVTELAQSLDSENSSLRSLPTATVTLALQTQSISLRRDQNKDGVLKAQRMATIHSDMVIKALDSDHLRPNTRRLKQSSLPTKLLSTRLSLSTKQEWPAQEPR